MIITTTRHNTLQADGVAGAGLTELPLRLEETGNLAEADDYTYAAGDFTLWLDGTSLGDPENPPVFNDGSWQLALSAAETNGKRLKIVIKDQDATKIITDTLLVVLTFGDANAYYPDNFAAPLVGTPASPAGLAADVAAIDGGAAAAEIADAVFAYLVETGLTFKHFCQDMEAALAGKVNGAGTGTENFRDHADTKNRLVVEATSVGDRTSVTHNYD